LHQSGSVSPTPSPIGFSPSASNTTKPLTPDVLLDDAIANSLSIGSASARRRVGRRKWGALGAVAGIVVAVIVLAHPPWAVAPDEPTVAPAVAHLPAAPPAPAPAPEPPPPAQAIVK